MICLLFLFYSCSVLFNDIFAVIHPLVVVGFALVYFSQSVRRIDDLRIDVDSWERQVEFEVVQSAIEGTVQCVPGVGNCTC